MDTDSEDDAVNPLTMHRNAIDIPVPEGDEVFLEEEPTMHPDDNNAATDAETPEELLRRLDEEKEDWQRQLAAMQEMMEDQDRKMEEDRCKRREYLDQEEAKKTQIVPVNSKAKPKVIKAKVLRYDGRDQESDGTNTPIGTRTMMAQVLAGKIPAAMDAKPWQMFPGLAQFANRRARNVAQQMPSLTYEAYLKSQQYSAGPARSSRGAISHQYAGNGQMMTQRVSGYPVAQRMQTAPEGRVVNAGSVMTSRPAKVLNVYDVQTTGAGPQRLRSYSTTSVQSSTSYQPSIGAGGSVIASALAPSSGFASGYAQSSGSSGVFSSSPYRPTVVASPAGFGTTTFTAAPMVQQASILSSTGTSWWDPAGLFTGSEPGSAMSTPMTNPRMGISTPISAYPTPMSAYRTA